MESLLAPLKVTWEAFRTWWEDSIPLLFLNLLWLVCWITIILGPPATFGMFHLTAELVEGYAITPKEMLVGARKYFLKSWAWMLANILIVAVLVTNVSFYSGIEASWTPYVIGLMIALLFFWTMVQFFTIPFLIIQEDKSLRRAWRNGMLTVLASPLFTFVMVLDIVLILILTITTVFPLFLGSGIFLVILGNSAVKERLATFDVILTRSSVDEDTADLDLGEQPD